MKKGYFAAVAAALAVFAAAILVANGSFSWFIDMSSLAVVLLPAFFLSWGVFGLPGIGRAFAASFRKEGAAEGELRKALAFFDAILSYLLLSGLLGSLVGIISMVGRIDDLKSIGLGMAIALLSLWYALILILAVAVPFRSGIRRRLAEAGKAG